MSDDPLRVKRIGTYDGAEASGWHVLTVDNESVSGGPFRTEEDATRVMRTIQNRPWADECLNCPPRKRHPEADHETVMGSTICIRCWDDTDPLVADEAPHNFRRYDP